MEVFAGFVEHADKQVGRLYDAIDSLGEKDNIVKYISTTYAMLFLISMLIFSIFFIVGGLIKKSLLWCYTLPSQFIIFII